MQTVSKALGALLSAIGLGGVTFTLLGLFDPQSAQLANDADPFGTPPNTKQLLLQLVASAAMLLTGMWLSFRRRRD